MFRKMFKYRCFKNRVFFIIFILFLFYGKQFGYKNNENNDVNLKKSYLNKGDRLIYFDIAGKEGINKKKQILNESQYSLVIIFSDNCFSCNKNIPLWNRMSLIKELKTYGIFLNKDEFNTYRENTKLKFKIYFPLNRILFKDNFNMNAGIDYTILLRGDRVIFFHMGILQVKEYFLLKSIVKHNKK